MGSSTQHDFHQCAGVLPADLFVRHGGGRGGGDVADVGHELAPGACEIAVHGYFEIEPQGFRERATSVWPPESPTAHGGRPAPSGDDIGRSCGSCVRSLGSVITIELRRGDGLTAAALQPPLTGQRPFDQVEVLDAARVDVDVKAVLQAGETARTQVQRREVRQALLGGTVTRNRCGQMARRPSRRPHPTCRRDHDR